MTVKRLSLADAEYIAHRLAVELNYDEPMPEFNTRYPGKLESCLAEPFHAFSGKSMHRSFAKKAAVLFYLVTKNHPFSNGNKRMAVTLTLVFCFINKRWVNSSPDVLYKIACDVAESKPEERARMQEILEKFFKEYMISFDALAK